MATPLPRHRRQLADVLDLTPPQLEQLIDGDEPVSTGADSICSAMVDHCTSLEQGAARLEMFEPIVIPGLLQTRAYTRAALRSGHLRLDEHVVARRSRVVRARQAVLARKPDPLELITVIDESVLHRVTGGPDVMAAQLKHLAAVASWSNVTIQIVPGGSGALHCAASGPFRLFTARGADTPFMICTDGLAGFRYVDRPPEIEAHSKLFDHLRAIALSPAESAQHIHSTAEQYS